MSSMEDAYDRSDAHLICRSFFANFESLLKCWSSLQLLMESDDRTFWTVVARHEKLPMVVDQLVKAVDESHATSSQKLKVSKEHETTLILFLVRLMTKFTGSVADGAAHAVQPRSAALRFAHIVPSSLLLPISLILMRRGGPLASVTIASFVFNCPLALSHFTGVISMWYDSVTQIASRCVVEAKRGRYQRRVGDVVPLLERSYRLAKHIWALVNSAPYVVDYLDRKKVCFGLRVLVDVVSPLLHHFLTTCDALVPRLPQLLKANSMLVNAAASALSTMGLVMTFTLSNQPSVAPVSCGRSGSRRHGSEMPAILHIEAVRHFDDDCGAYILTGCRGAAVQALKRGNLSSAIRGLQQPPFTEQPPPTFNEVMNWLLDPIPNSNDFSSAIIPGNDTLATALLRELSNQNISLEVLVARGFMKESEAARFAPSDPQQTKGPRPSSSSAAAASSTSSHRGGQEVLVETGDPAIDMVRSVLPHLSVPIVQQALQYFHNDVELLINEALCGNMPPHLQDAVAAEEAATLPDELPAALPAAVASVVANVLDFDETPVGDMEAFLSSDYQENVGSKRPEDLEDAEASETMHTLHPFSSTLSETLYVDDGFKENTFEFLYDDERDDAEDGEGGHTWGAAGDSVSSDDESPALRPLNQKGLHIPGSSKSRPVSEPAAAAAGGHAHASHGKQHPAGKQRGGRGSGVAEAAAGVATAPAYGKKSTVKPTRKGGAAGGGGSKAAVMRSVRKGNFE